MTIEVGASGGTFVTKAESGMLLQTIGISGGVITITPPTGQRVRLTSLVSQVVALSPVSVFADGVTIVNGLNLAPQGTGATGDLVIGHTFITAAGQTASAEIMGDRDEVITISALTAGVDRDVIYTYQTGVIA